MTDGRTLVEELEEQARERSNRSGDMMYVAFTPEATIEWQAARRIEELETELARLSAEHKAMREALNGARVSFETRTKREGVTTSTHALHNLEGAIIDIERKGSADAVSLRTLHRVAEQLAAIERALSAAGD